MTSFALKENVRQGYRQNGGSSSGSHYFCWKFSNIAQGRPLTCLPKGRCLPVTLPNRLSVCLSANLSSPPPVAGLATIEISSKLTSAVGAAALLVACAARVGAAPSATTGHGSGMRCGLGSM